MRVPTRRGEQNIKKEIDFHVTADKLKKMKAELKNLIDFEQPAAAKEVQRTAAFGDFSENAEYKEAKSRLRKILSRIDSLRKKIAHAVVIQVDKSLGVVQLGSRVVVEYDNQTKIFYIVGSSEVKLDVGRISHSSPVGRSLLGKKVGDLVEMTSPSGKKVFLIKQID